MKQKSPYELAKDWVINHPCDNSKSLTYSVKYEEVQKNVFNVTCIKCGCKTQIVNA